MVGNLREFGTLLWLDMEMTGLDVNIEAPIEVAVIATDWSFKELGVYQAVIKQPADMLERMDNWNKKTHGETGLLNLIPQGKNIDSVDQELIDFIARHFDKTSKDKPILAGNTINQDRLFIRKYLPKLEASLHYRMLDVTSLKVLFKGLFDLSFKKKDGHRALDDIRESIAELQYYLGFIKP